MIDADLVAVLIRTESLCDEDEVGDSRSVRDSTEIEREPERDPEVDSVGQTDRDDVRDLVADSESSIRVTVVSFFVEVEE